MLQMPRKNFWDLQERCKCHEKSFGVCRNAANATKKNLALAGTLQMPRKNFGTCRNAANATKNFLAFAGTLQTLSKLRRRLIGYPIPLK